MAKKKSDRLGLTRKSLSSNNSDSKNKHLEGAPKTSESSLSGACKATHKSLEPLSAAVDPAEKRNRRSSGKRPPSEPSDRILRSASRSSVHQSVEVIPRLRDSRSSVPPKKRPRLTLEDTDPSQLNTGNCTSTASRRGSRSSIGPVGAFSNPPMAASNGNDQSVTGQGLDLRTAQQADSEASLATFASPANTGILPPPPPPPTGQRPADSTSSFNSGRFHPSDPASSFRDPHAVFFQCGIMDATSPEDMQRLHQLLESNSFLGVQMHQLMTSRMSSSSSQRAQQLLHNLQSARGDEEAQLRSLDELHQILLMGNEDILSGFPVKAAVPLLTQCLQSHNIQLSLLACQSLQCMMDRLPRSSSSIVDCLPILLEKMQPFEIIDVAEVALSAVELLSRRHGKAILVAGGVSACLMHIDFFMADLQYKALSIVANCFQHLRSEDFSLVSDSLPLLTERLKQTDARIVERVCLCFSRLVDSYHNDPKILKNLAAQDLISNLQQLLMTSPPLLSSSSFQSVLHMLSTMCISCPDLAVVMLRLNMADTLRYLLIGGSSVSKGATAVAEFFLNRSTAEILEIVRLICELLPALPQKNLFSINSSACLLGLNSRFPVSLDGMVEWQWQDDRGAWHSYSRENSLLIEQAYQSNESQEIPLSASGRLYLVDLTRGEQINEETGNTRPVQRKAQVAASGSGVQNTVADSRVDVFTENSDLAQSLVSTLFSVLFDVFSESSGHMVRLACLQAILRMLYFTCPDILASTVNPHVVASHIATMLASPDIRVIVGALQMSDILLDKMSDQVSLSFRRQGLVYNLEKLMTGHHSLFDKPTSVSLPSTPQPSSALLSPSNPPEFHSGSPTSGKLGDILRRKKPASKSNRKSRDLEESCQTTSRVTRSKDTASTKMKTGSSTGSPGGGRLAAKAQSFLNTFAPRWSSQRHATSAPGGLSTINSRHSAGQHAQELLKSTEQTKAWVRDHSSHIFSVHFSLKQELYDPDFQNSLVSPSSHHDHEVTVSKLKAAGEALLSGDNVLPTLLSISSLLVHADLSSFELIHSELVPNLLRFLVSNSDTSILQFSNVFLGVPADSTSLQGPVVPNGHALLSHLVTRLLGCLSQTEQFSVRVHDTKGGGSILRYLNTHQLKCHLVRHPDCASSTFGSNSSGFEPSGPVKVDPLALVATVERYLANRLDAGDSEADTSDTEDELEEGRIQRQSITRPRTRLQLLIGDNTLPSNMTVFQAVRQFSPLLQAPQASSSTGPEDDLLVSTNSLWSHTHTIFYRPMLANETNNSSSPSFVNRIPTRTKSRESSSISTADSASKSRRKRWTEGVIPKPVSPLVLYQDSDTLSNVSGVTEPCKSVLTLLNTLYGLNKHLSWIYSGNYAELEPLLPLTDFLSVKLSSKMTRQLQDPLVVLTSQIPQWVPQLATACPFLLSFEVRHLLLYVHSFDRDRAMLKLQEVSGDTSVGSDSSGDTSRVAPKIEKKRRTVSRKDLLKVCDKLLEELASSKAMLEISYENEAGTGLGPTLEFYSLVCKELCKADLGIWRKGEDANGFSYSASGLYPRPLPRTTSGISRLRSRFKMIGRLMAKAVVDSRKLDLPLSPVLYKWLLGQESSLSYQDLVHVDIDLARSWRQLAQVVNQKKQIENDMSHTQASRELALGSLSLDGCPIEDLGLEFTLPGYPEVELLKGGKDTPVTLDTLEDYLNLVVHCTLVEGVQRQMEALLEGFESVFSTANLKLFYPEELEMVFCGGNPSVDSWDTNTLAEACRPDHGFTLESRAIKFLFQIMSEFNAENRRKFLQFVTGSPRLPVGGWRSLNPPLTIVVKKMEGEHDPDSFLPSATTCVNYLKLPDYSSLEAMRSKMLLAMQEGQLAFHLS